MLVNQLPRLQNLKFYFSIAVVFLVAAGNALGLILYDNGSTDNSYNTTTTGMPTTQDSAGATLSTFWNSVVAVAQPSEDFNASAVYLGNGYFLTAKHVSAVQVGQEVKINGITYTLATDFGAGGILNVETLPGISEAVDLKIFRVLDAPDLPAVTLNTSTTEVGKTSYVVGCGVGKGIPLAAQGWQWGNATTYQKRWGFTGVSQAANDPSAGACLISFFVSAYGRNAASATLGDSGGALFQLVDGKWSLVGIAVGVSTANASYYAGSPTTGSYDASFYVRISNYAEAIKTAIVSPVPEPSTLALLALGFTALVLRKRN